MQLLPFVVHFSSFLFPLLPALAAASSIAALAPVVAVLLGIASKRVAAAHGKRCGSEAIREVDLCADGVGEVGHYEDVLNVCVAVRLLVWSQNVGFGV
jgi:hypothetical protein